MASYPSGGYPYHHAARPPQHYPPQHHQQQQQQQPHHSYGMNPSSYIQGPLQPGQFVRPVGAPQSPVQQQQQGSNYSPSSRPGPPQQTYSSSNSSHSVGGMSAPLPNPHEAGYRPQPSTTETDEAYEAALAASRSTLAEEEARRKRLEEEELRRLQASDEEERRRREERERDEERELQRVMEQSRLDEEARERDARQREERALEESRLEAAREEEERRRRDDEELRRVMEQSLREEWERRREAELEEIRLVEVARREIEERQARQYGQTDAAAGPSNTQGLGVQSNAVAGSSRGHGTIEGSRNGEISHGYQSRRPLPSLPQADDPHADAQGHDHDPFTDQAEAPPDYDSVHSDRPPDAPSRAPTGIFGPPYLAICPAAPHVDPVEEKRRMEGANGGSMHDGEQQQEPRRPGAFHIANPSASMRQQSPSHSRRPLPVPVPLPASSYTDSSQDGATSASASTFEDTPGTSVQDDGEAVGAEDKMHVSRRPRRESSVTIASTTSRSQLARGQTTPLGIDWGYSDTAFGGELRCDEGDDDDDENEDTDAKARFPNTITLGGDTSRYFTIRCGSWRLLLRTLAWLGNTSVEAFGSGSLSDASPPALLRMEVEFVTPSMSLRRTSTSSLLAPEHYGGSNSLSLDEIVRRAAGGEGSESGQPRLAACVSLCLSVVVVENSAGKRTASTERELDMAYLQRQSTRKVLHIPPSSMGLSPTTPTHVQKGFTLPCTLISLAQTLQKAHRFSAACPTSGYTARHTPRDLYHIIESHDEKFVKRLQGESRRIGVGMALDHTRPILLWDPRPKDDEEAGDAADEYTQQHLTSRVRDKVRRKWRGRQGHVEDGTEEELRSWITPLDLSDVG